MKKDFLWGNSVSSMQTEGAWNVGGKGLSVYDVKPATKTTSDWKDGIQDYYRYQEGFDLMKEQGMNCYRFQISWSRVVPEGDGEFNEEGIQFYHQFIDELIARDIQPMICLYHFDMPLKLAQEHNGFLSKKVVQDFYRFAKRMIDEYSGKVKLWITFNEQNFSIMDKQHSFGMSGSLDENLGLEKTYQIAHNIAVAHAMVANYLHSHSDAKIGPMLAYQLTYPATCHPKDILLAKMIDEVYNHSIIQLAIDGKYLPILKKELENKDITIEITDEEEQELSQVHSDFIALSYYQSATVSYQNIKTDDWINDYLELGRVKNPYLRTTEFDWEIDSVGLRTIVTSLYNRYQLPIFPIENGIGAREHLNDNQDMIEDDYRITYHNNHLSALKQAIEKDGCDVMGYLGWGLIDIPSSSGDMEKRYGTVFVNRTNHDLKDLKRIPKKSFYWFQKVIESNGNIIQEVHNNDEYR